MKLYTHVRGHARVRAIEEALEESGAKILKTADPTIAPFQFRIQAPNGEFLQLVCYAFTANEYRQRNRPSGEHRFQIKYGSDFKRYHDVYVDEDRSKITLFLGVHDDLPLFIAADPAMHSPTWFSVSVEFRIEELRHAQETGWHGWERVRSESRRKNVMPKEDLRTEVLVAFRPENFLRYVGFEQICTGVDPGERLLLSDRVEEGKADAVAAMSSKPVPAKRRASKRRLTHPLEEQFGISCCEVLDVILGRFRLLAAVRGSIAEHHLGRYLLSESAFDEVERLDKDGQPDFTLRFANRTFRVECKNVLRKLTSGAPLVDFQKTRASKNDPCSRYYAPTQFEVLSACLHPVSENWEFRFCATQRLAPHKKCPGKLHHRVLVEGPNWYESLPDLLQVI